MRPYLDGLAVEVPVEGGTVKAHALVDTGVYGCPCPPHHDTGCRAVT